MNKTYNVVFYLSLYNFCHIFHKPTVDQYIQYIYYMYLDYYHLFVCTFDIVMMIENIDLNCFQEYPDDELIYLILFHTHQNYD